MGIFYKRFSVQIVSDFYNHCADYSNLNDDFKHCLFYHFGHEDKIKIAQMTEKYQSIFDFICNFQQNEVNLVFYNKRMDLIYDGMTIKPETPQLQSQDVSSSSESSNQSSTHAVSTNSILNTLPPTTNSSSVYPQQNNVHNVNIQQNQSRLPFVGSANKNSNAFAQIKHDPINNSNVLNVPSMNVRQMNVPSTMTVLNMAPNIISLPHISINQFNTTNNTNLTLLNNTNSNNMCQIIKSVCTCYIFSNYTNNARMCTFTVRCTTCWCEEGDQE